jgi:hypothetical protein
LRLLTRSLGLQQDKSNRSEGLRDFIPRDLMEMSLFLKNTKA